MNESKGIAGTFLELFTFASSVELILLLFTSDFARSLESLLPLLLLGVLFLSKTVFVCPWDCV